jgi:hypothetical protein
MHPSRLILLFPAIIVAALLGTPAVALDSSKPSADCTGALITDKAGDVVDRLGGAADNLDVTSVFIKDEPAKGAEAVTANIVVKNLSTDVPAGNTGITWIVYYDLNGTTYFVRAVHDLTGATVFEHGSFIDVGGVTSVSPRDSDVPGKLFEGPDGVLQLVIPAADAKPGTQLKNVYAETREVLQVVPSNVPTPTRGLGAVADDAPDSGGRSYTVAPAACAAAGAPKPGAPAAGAAVKLKLATKSVAAKQAKKGKSLALKISSSGKVTGLKATLKKGKASVGAGKLASLDGTGTLKVKLSKTLKKGSYTLSLAGSDSAGKKVAAAAKLSVR